MSEDDSPEHGSMSRTEILGCIAFLVILLALFTAEVVDNFHPVKLAILFIVLFWIPMLFVDEAGHALVATLAGWHVRRVVLGMGRRVARFRVGAVPVELRIVPVEGFVDPSPRNLRMPQLKSALIYFAGPGTELLVLAVLAWAVGVETMLTAPDPQNVNMGLLAAQSLAVVILASALVNLVPHYIITPTGKMANDGLGIIQSFLRPTRDYYHQMERSDEPWGNDPDEWKER
jgi:hypothetical protein